ncbi:MAG TPA: hypothetical protein VFL41_13205 [Gaiellaceae bacterium]|nr:hypothetical protein [Gaiellaceae bacterium]
MSIVSPYVKPGSPPNRWPLLVVWLAITLFAVTLFVGVTPAAAKAPCWQRLIQDWYDDGRIDGSYSAKCISEARKHVPEDVAVYGSLDEQLMRERKELSRRPASAGSGTAPAPTAPPSGPQLTEEPKRGLFKAAFDKTAPRNADSVPLPLLILAGLALALMAAGAAGLVARYVRARRARAT